MPCMCVYIYIYRKRNKGGGHDHGDTRLDSTYRIMHRLDLPFCLNASLKAGLWPSLSVSANTPVVMEIDAAVQFNIDVM